MNAKYRDLYKGLIQAYYNNHFEEELDQFFQEFEDPKEAKQVLAALCGVEEIQEKEDHAFVYDLVDAITKNQVRSRVVQKIGVCKENCDTAEGKSKCQSVCPFDAIRTDEKSLDKLIDEDLCVSCGRCVDVCDMGYYMDVPQALPLMEILKKNEKVIAIVAPAIAGQFGKDVTLDQLREAFIKIGFLDMIEVAMAADILSMKEAMEYDKFVKEDGDFMITSCCCPVWVSMLRKVYHNLISEVSPSVSPMVAMGRIIKKLNKDTKVVFIGPCIAKKAEAKEPDISDAVDYVLTFEETKLIFEAFGIEPDQLVGIATVEYASTGGRLYARAGGVSHAVWDVIDEMYPEKRNLFRSMQVDGVPDCKKMLDELEKGNTRASFIEGMGCKGGCVGGPKRNIPVEEGTECVNEKAHESAIKMPMHSQIIVNLLEEIGMESLNDLRDDHSLFERRFDCK